MLWQTVKDYCANSTIHGLQFITEDGRHGIERLFWVLSCALSWYGSWLLIVASYEAAQQSPISFVVDTTYVHWDTPFPAVSVCEADNMDRVYDVADRIFTPDHDFNLDEVLKEMAYFRGNVPFTAQFCFDGSIECPQTDLIKYANMIRTSCDEMFHSCRWNNEIFDCCSQFLPLSTEFGSCFSINSIHTSDNASTVNRMISNISTGPGTLRIELNAPAEVHWHSPSDVPFFNKLSSDSVMTQLGTFKRRSLSLRETVNEPEVRSVDSVSRNCRYPHENTLTLYKYYSYSACIVECRQRASMALCNCSTHMMNTLNSNDKPCDLNGLNCLHKNYDKLTVLKNHWNVKKGDMYCECMPGCEEPEINIVIDENLRMNEPLNILEIVLDRLPVERFKRIVVRSKLDLVVSMGGTAGLFVGASLLSTVELLYYFSVRLCLALCKARAARKEASKDKGVSADPKALFMKRSLPSKISHFNPLDSRILMLQYLERYPRF